MAAIVLKFTFEDDIRRVSLDQPMSLTKIRSTISSILSIPSFHLKYKDNEGEKITISCERDLQEVVASVTQSGGVLRLSVLRDVQHDQIISPEVISTFPAPAVPSLSCGKLRIGSGSHHRTHKCHPHHHRARKCQPQDQENVSDAPVARREKGVHCKVHNRARMPKPEMEGNPHPHRDRGCKSKRERKCQEKTQASLERVEEVPEGATIEENASRKGCRKGRGLRREVRPCAFGNGEAGPRVGHCLSHRRAAHAEKFGRSIKALADPNSLPSSVA